MHHQTYCELIQDLSLKIRLCRYQKQALFILVVNVKQYFEVKNVHFQILQRWQLPLWPDPRRLLLNLSTRFTQNQKSIF